MEASNQCLPWILREMFALNYKVMQVVSKVFGAYMTTMTVENSKEAHLRPFTIPLFVLGLQNIQDNTDSVLVVFSNDTLVSISGICLHDSAFFIWCLSDFMIFELEGLRVERYGVLSKEQSLHINKCHILWAIRFGWDTMCLFEGSGRSASSCAYRELAAHSRSSWILEKRRTTGALDGALPYFSMTS